MSEYSSDIQALIEHFTRLPGIGPKTAERLVFYLLTQGQPELASFSQALSQVKDSLKVCQQCYNFSQFDPCSICRDQKRSQGVICVVSTPQDLMAIEKTGDYLGVYHVLGGVIDPLEGMTPENLKVKELLVRIKKNNAKEIILALNPDMPGETTMLYLSKLIKKNPGIKVTKLARGLPVGSDLEYADEVTLSSALRGRREV